MRLKNRTSLAAASLLSCTGQSTYHTTISENIEKGDTASNLEEVVVDTREKVYLTIDDGPSKYTKSILEFLNQSWHQATFFFLWENLKHKDSLLYQELIKSGHWLGNHSFSHPNFKKLSLQAAKTQVLKTANLFQELIGQDAQFFRYPYGSEVKRKDQSAFQNFLDSLGYGEQIFWDIDTRDRDHKTSRSDLISKLKDIKAGDIILIHEKSRTVPETLVIIDSILQTKSLRSAKMEHQAHTPPLEEK